jgi:thiol-disulfide isomerase/thioredoxin
MDENEVEAQLERADKAFILFYESWCPFSRRFLPIFEKFAEKERRQCIQVVADFKMELCDKYSIEVFPTVLFFEKGQVTKRLDGHAGEGLSKKELESFAENC